MPRPAPPKKSPAPEPARSSNPCKATATRCSAASTAPAADLVILSEPDGTFSGHDVIKLLAYSDDVPVVFGTRTTREFIWQGANMGNFLRWGNWAVAKMTELLFNTTLLTDMGCTQRLLSREAMQLIRPHLTIGGSHFGPQVLLEVIEHGIPFVEIPMNYRARVGESSVTGSCGKPGNWVGA